MTSLMRSVLCPPQRETRFADPLTPWPSGCTSATSVPRVSPVRERGPARFEPDFPPKLSTARPQPARKRGREGKKRRVFVDLTQKRPRHDVSVEFPSCGGATVSIRPEAGSARPGRLRNPHRIQREHELAKALEAARHLQAWLEMLGDRRADVEAIRLLRDSLATDLVDPSAGQGPSLSAHLASRTTTGCRNDDGGSSS